MRIAVILSMFIFSLFADKIATIKIEGMTCPLCTVAIKRSLNHIEGVIKAKVKLNTHTATVEYRDDINESKLLEAIKRAGGYRGEIISIKDTKN